MARHKFPIDVATNHSVSFATKHVATDGAILELGCGEGYVAIALQDTAYCLHGFDHNREAVAIAQRKGLNVGCAMTV